MGLRIVTCVYKRPEIVRAFLHHLNYLRDATGLELPISIAYSTKEDLEVLKEFCTKSDHLVMLPNETVGNKWNELCKAVYNDTKESHYIMVGSDDFLNVEYVEHLNEYRYDHAGVDKFLIYSPMHKRVVKHNLNRSPFVLSGGGRMISREVFEAIYSEGKDLYCVRLNGGLDNNSELVMKKFGFNPVLIEFENAFIDVKSELNIHSFDEFETNEDESYDVIDLIIPNVSFE